MKCNWPQRMRATSPSDRPKFPTTPGVSVSDIRSDKKRPPRAYGSVVWWCVGKLRFGELVNLCRQDEIALRQTVDLVRPGCDIDFSPGKRDVWVVSLLLSKLTHAIYEFESSAKIRKLEGLRDVMFFDDVPPIDLLLK